jgi:hypothetical protein
LPSENRKLTIHAPAYLIVALNAATAKPIMSPNLITLIGIVDSLATVVREFKSDLQCKEEVLGKLGTLKKELLDAKLKEASVALHAQRLIEVAIAGIYPAFACHPEIQVFISGVQHLLMASVLPPPLPSCSVSKSSVL